MICSSVKHLNNLSCINICTHEYIFSILICFLIQCKNVNLFVLCCFPIESYSVRIDVVFVVNKVHFCITEFSFMITKHDFSVTIGCYIPNETRF